MSFFIGEFNYTIDDKGRVNIPAKFRKNLNPKAKNKFIITQGKDICLDVYSMDVFKEKIVNKINEFSVSDDSLRYYSSLKGSTSIDVDLDKQGRIAIPQRFLDYARITKDILIIGAFYRIELWNPNIRKEYLEKMKNTELQIKQEQLP